MNSKNLVSLSVAVVFGVLAVTGLLIYFAQGGHIVDHIHAWFGILFTAAAVFHIVNNWLSLKAYARERRTGRIRREFVAPTLLAVLFVAGIGFDWPVFGKLANAGKELVRGPRPKPQPLAQPTADSIAQAVEMAYGRAVSTGDTAALKPLLAEALVLMTADGQRLTRADFLADVLKGHPKAITPAGGQPASTVGKRLLVTPVDDNLLLVNGNLTQPDAGTNPIQTRYYTHLLKKQRDTWQITAGQVSGESDARDPLAGK